MVNLIVTRPEGENIENESEALRVIHLPVTRIRKVELSDSEKNKLIELGAGKYRCIIFSSSNGVKYFSSTLSSVGLSIPAGTLIAAQGKKTNEAVRAAFGRDSDIIPDIPESEQFAQFIVSRKINGPFLYPCARETRGKILEVISANNQELDELIVYETVVNEPNSELINQVIGLDPHETFFSFMSPSAFKSTLHWMSGVTEFLHLVNIVSIGPVTSESIRDAGFHVALEATDASFESLVADIFAFSSSH